MIDKTFKQKILFTFDVESGNSVETFDTLIWGRTSFSNEEWGLKKQIELLNKYRVRGLFFLDFAEAWSFGEDKIANVARYIVNSGHDVGVHLHPHHMHPKRKHFLYEYSKEEQYEMIRKCSDLYRTVLKKEPKSFRAGKYGANYDTLDILNELGYSYDFSEFYSQRWCGLNPPVCVISPTKYKSVLEIPVTVFKSFDLKNIYKRFDKLEFDINFRELRGVMNKIHNQYNSNSIIILFAHSFSFLDFRGKENTPIPIPNKVEKFERILRYTKAKSTCFQFISEDDLEDIKACDIRDNEEIVVKNDFFESFYYIFLRSMDMFSYNKKAQVLVISFIFVAILLIIIMSLIILRFVGYGI